MTHYRATSPDGDVIEYDADLPLPEHKLAPWRLEDVSEAVPTPDQLPDPPPVHEWSSIEFMRMFTMQERMSIRDAEKTNPVVADLFDLLRQAPTIHSNDPDVMMGLGYLTQIGLLSVGRSDVILSAPGAANG